MLVNAILPCMNCLFIASRRKSYSHNWYYYNETLTLYIIFIETCRSGNIYKCRVVKCLYARIDNHMECSHRFTSSKENPIIAGRKILQFSISIINPNQPYYQCIDGFQEIIIYLHPLQTKSRVRVHHHITHQIQKSNQA